MYFEWDIIFSVGTFIPIYTMEICILGLLFPGYQKKSYLLHFWKSWKLAQIVMKLKNVIVGTSFLAFQPTELIRILRNLNNKIICFFDDFRTPEWLIQNHAISPTTHNLKVKFIWIGNIHEDLHFFNFINVKPAKTQKGWYIYYD